MTRLFLIGAIAVSVLAAALVFTGVWPPYYTREFSDEDFGPARFDYRFVDFDALPGWADDDPGPALEVFVRSCAAFEERDPQSPANPNEQTGLTDGDAVRGAAPVGASFGGVVADWLRPCSEARALIVSAYGDAEARRGALRSFFEFHFRPAAIAARRAPTPGGRAQHAPARIESRGTFTGYFEPLYEASRERTERHSSALLPRPDDLIEVELGRFRDDLKGERIAGRVIGGRLTPFEDRRDINEDGLALAAAPIAWLDPNDHFFLQIQGSGRLDFGDGEVLRVGYAGQNGHPYTAIGRVMVERQIMPLDEVSMQSIRSWLEEAPVDAARAMREENASYVFFTELDAIPPELGPLGAQGVPLTPGRSLAVDRRFHTLGAPVWVDIEPVAEAGGAPIRKLMIAQDTGGAIRGPVRGDFFWGAGDDAAEIAGAMNAQGEFYVFLPRRLADRLQNNGLDEASP